MSSLTPKPEPVEVAETTLSDASANAYDGRLAANRVAVDELRRAVIAVRDAQYRAAKVLRVVLEEDCWRRRLIDGEEVVCETFVDFCVDDLPRGLACIPEELHAWCESVGADDVAAAIPLP
jgi:hypothetical protein